MWNVSVSVSFRVGVRTGVQPMRMYPLFSCRAARPCPGRNVIVVLLATIILVLLAIIIPVPILFRLW